MLVAAMFVFSKSNVCADMTKTYFLDIYVLETTTTAAAASAATTTTTTKTYFLDIWLFEENLLDICFRKN